eukprot:CAMPEP_0204253420 /NCGR_PEP_ID=MMETSP0468-20130131/1863_1 /ASSEMBLY_ACC=CAM_ASM_000383 /TAXON_ID=2969 /ORGANISM="Oxyrrhis marina" /LENGTH=48 /DNA_ID= /DNA_START= /DNA_END= /DNA_ORIENTATION=
MPTVHTSLGRAQGSSTLGPPQENAAGDTRKQRHGMTNPQPLGPAWPSG